MDVALVMHSRLRCGQRVSVRRKLYHHAVWALYPLANCTAGNDSSSQDVVNLRPVAAWGKMMFPWFAATMLAMESNHVVGLRLRKLAFGGHDAGEEAMLMLTEKIAAALEAGATMLTGGTPSLVVARYREHVMANAGRLSSD